MPASSNCLIFSYNESPFRLEFFSQADGDIIGWINFIESLSVTTNNLRAKIDALGV